MEDETLATLRYCFQRILVPCIVVIGVLGNFISVIVLTRKRMRCSTNIYLTALAVADIVYLLFIFVLSLQHYPNIHHSKYKIYWSTFGLSHWFCDASSYTSIYLTVSFTVERYIAVCHPIRGQVLCTESRAKRVIAGVVILCFLLTVSTAFEYKLLEKTEYIDKNNGKPCLNRRNDLLLLNQQNRTMTTSLSNMFGGASSGRGGAGAAGDGAVGTNESDDDDLNRDLTTEKDDWKVYYEEDGASDDEDDSPVVARTNYSNLNLTDDGLSASNRNSCELIHFIYASMSDFGQNDRYKEIFYIFTSTFGTFVPLIMLATFNCFLVAAVHRSYQMRHKMTNTRQSDTSTAQENKITVTLIAVVLLFLVCQTPAAIQLIYTMKVIEITNMNRALNNLCNFLVALNAACNFLLYCALSDKYRKTVKQLFFGRKPRRQNTVSSSRFSRYASSQTSGTSLIYNNRPSTGDIGGGSVIRNRAAQKAKNARFSITPTDYAKFQAEMAVEHAKTQSLVAADFLTAKNRTASAPIPMSNLADTSKYIQVNHNNNQQSSDDDRRDPTPTDTAETTLLRATSLVFPTITKHSPDCKYNPNIF